jgi:hypothetical protein
MKARNCSRTRLKATRWERARCALVAAPNDVFACVVQAARKQKSLHDAALLQAKQEKLAAKKKFDDLVRPHVWFARRRGTSEFWFVGWRSKRGTHSYWLPTDGFLASVRSLRPPKWQWAVQLPFVLRQVGLARQRARSRSVRNRLLICVRKLRPLLLI